MVRPGRTARVWDRPVRVLHWSLAASLVAAWTTSEVGTRWHEGIGYAVLGIVAARLAWGFFGSPTARFASFVASPVATLAYLRRVLRHDEPRYVGHNPLGAWMVLALLGCASGAAATGWLYTTDRFWGDDTTAMLHRVLAWTTLALVPVHVAGVVFSSRRHRENLLLAMLDGRKREAAESDVA